MVVCFEKILNSVNIIADGMIDYTYEGTLDKKVISKGLEIFYIGN